MGETFYGFLSREDRCTQLGCGPFEFDRDEDLFVATGHKDASGIFKRADQLLRPFHNSHRKAVVVLDCEWDTSPGQAEIRKVITRQLIDSEWDNQQFVVIAINPELEQWIWQDSPVLEAALHIMAHQVYEPA